MYMSTSVAVLTLLVNYRAKEWRHENPEAKQNKQFHTPYQIGCRCKSSFIPYVDFLTTHPIRFELLHRLYVFDSIDF